MQLIPPATLKEVLALRTENGLVATEAALEADLAKSKAKWTLVETSRYRRAGRSPIYVSGKYLTTAGICPATGEAEGSARKQSSSSKASGVNVGHGNAVDETAFFKALHGMGFVVKLSKDLLTGELEAQLPPSISKLEMKFGSIPANSTAIHVVQTSPQVQVSMSLDKFLEMAGIKA